MKVGIIGLGLSGKSSLFHALTGQAPEPPSGQPHRRLGRAQVADEHLEYMALNEDSKKRTYAEVNFMDPSGFPPDSVKNLSAEMLGMVTGCDLLVLCIRAFAAPSIMHPLTSVDPMRDLNICFGDLIIHDLEIFEGLLERSTKAFNRGQKELKPDIEVFEKAIPALSEDKFLSQVEWLKLEVEILIRYEPLTLKSGVVLCNVDESTQCAKGGGGVPDNVRQLSLARGWGAEAARLSLESELMEIDEAEREEFRQEFGMKETARDWFLSEVYDRLGLLSFYTTGPTETAARTIIKGQSAWDAAGKIHSDIQRGFIRAEVMSFEDYKKYGSEDGVKKAGRYRIEKKEYVVQEGDIFYFRFNV